MNYRSGNLRMPFAVGHIEAILEIVPIPENMNVVFVSIAADKFGVLDREIQDAIRTHTTGAPNMSMLQKIIYVADYIEPNRDDIIPHIEDIQTLAFTDIDKAVCVIAKNIIDYLEEHGRDIDPATRATYDFYKKLTEGK